MGTFFVLFIIAAIIFAVVASNISKSNRIQILKQAYDQSLKGENKRAALAAGRAYYSALRENKALTIYDEQAITNDLSTMRVSNTLQTV